MNKNNIADILFEMGISPGLVGFQHIIDIVNMLQNKEYDSLTEIYNIIGEKKKINPKSIDSAIRIATAHINTSSDAYEKYMNPSVISLKTYGIMTKPFLYTLAYKVMQKDIVT